MNFACDLLKVNFTGDLLKVNFAGDLLKVNFACSNNNSYTSDVIVEHC